ncbi:MAG: outer membrane beta-barrel protein [Bacteroidia bacterium]
MKKIFLCFISTLIVAAAYAQRKKEFQIRGGFGFAVYGTTTEFAYTPSDPDLVLKDEDGAATVHLPLELRYEISQRFNLGLDLKWGSYLYDPDSSEGKANRFYVIGFGAEYTLVNNDNFRWYLGAGFNAAGLELEEDYTFLGLPVHQVATYSGGGFRLNSGVLWFFAGPFGLNFNMGFDSHNFKLKDLEQNGQASDLSDIEGSLTVKGADFTLGLVVRL